MIYLGKKLKTFVTFDFVNIRSSRRYFAYRGPGMSFILKESPNGVTQTRPLFRLANLNGCYRHITEMMTQFSSLFMLEV